MRTSPRSRRGSPRGPNRVNVSVIFRPQAPACPGSARIDGAMGSSCRGLLVLAGLGVLGCVARLPVDGASCPCPAAYECREGTCALRVGGPNTGGQPGGGGTGGAGAGTGGTEGGTSGAGGSTGGAPSPDAGGNADAAV